MQREAKVGAVVIAAIIVLAAGVFLVGEQNRVFSRKNEYFVEFQQVAGLAVGNPVQLDGVTVGRVTRIVLPVDFERALLRVEITLERRYAERIREDSIARIKTLGLLGDRYVDLISGSAEFPQIPARGQIPAAPVTDVDRIIASGEDVLGNLGAMSVSLREILARMERGEGMLGELTTHSGKPFAESVRELMDSLNTVTAKIDSSEGVLGRLIGDPQMADQFESVVAKLDSSLSAIEEGDGIVADLLHNSETRDQVRTSVANLDSASSELVEFSKDLREADGLLGKLLNDEQYSKEVSEDLNRLFMNLNELTAKINQGEGTLGKLINDPSVYEAVDDILVGVEESKFLSWLVQNRQKKGIEVRYDEAQEELEAEDANSGGG